MLRSSAVLTTGFMVLLVFVGGCGPDIKTVVTFDRARIPTLGKVGIVSVYEPHGPTPGVINLLAGQTPIELFRAASPAEDLRTKFAQRVSGLTGPMVEIGGDEPEVVRVRGTMGLAKYDYYQVEKLDYKAIGNKYGVQTLIVLRTWDFAARDGGPATLSLHADARMVNVRTSKILWHKKIGGFGCYFQVGRIDSAERIRKEFAPIVDCVVEHLSKDFQGSSGTP